MVSTDDEEEDFCKMHPNILPVPVAYFGSSEEEVEKAMVFDAYKVHLAQLGLLRRNFKKPKKGELPEFDERTGTIKSSGYSITALGRSFIRWIESNIRK
jgi:hypothetical protein